MHIEDGLLMRRTVKLIETSGDAFVDRFAEIIDALPEEATRHMWYVVRLYGEGDMPRAVGCNMRDVLETIDRDGAFRISWSALQAMSRAMSQLFDLLIVGDAPESALPPGPPKDEGFQQLSKNHDIVIEAFDSSEWRIGGCDERSVETVAAKVAASQ